MLTDMLPMQGFPVPAHSVIIFFGAAISEVELDTCSFGTMTHFPLHIAAAAAAAGFGGPRPSTHFVFGAAVREVELETSTCTLN